MVSMPFGGQVDFGDGGGGGGRVAGQSDDGRAAAARRLSQTMAGMTQISPSVARLEVVALAGGRVGQGGENS